MRKFVLFLFVLAVLAAGVLAALRAGPEPAISIETSAKAIGRKTPITVAVSEPKRGLAGVKVELVQGDLATTVKEARHEPSRPWELWKSGATPSDALRLEVGKDSMPGLKQGKATIRVTAERASAWLRSPGPVVKELELPVLLTPPTVQVLSNFTYVAQGGAEAVVYRVGETAVRDGVQAGSRFFPGYPLPGGGARDRFALFAVPYDMDSAASVRVVAEDDAGNVSQARFVDQFFAKPLRRDTIRLDDAFMEKVTTEIMAATPDLEDKGGLLENYLQINRDLRKTNNAFLDELAAKSTPKFLWRGPFLPMVNTAIKASFADRRSYVYGGRTVDQQDHLGLDMASVRADAVPAANDGTIAFAAYLGIYGNCVVIDHGYGLQTLYGHLSSISVKEGDSVKRGQEVGRSGATGLAGGDHLHFSVLLHGLSITPIEWFDPKWIHDRLKLKLGPALP
jgi:murein DD-endopeptidase MepM/ murein hydrolase activator NlpD